MLKLIGWAIKITLFSILVLVLGNWVKWRGMTVSDQVRVHLSHAERAAPHIPRQLQEKLHDKIDAVQKWSETNGVNEAEEGGAQNDYGAHSKRSVQKGGLKTGQNQAASEEIPSTERQKLRALIRELNSSRSLEN